MHVFRLPRALWVLLLAPLLMGFGTQEANFCPEPGALTIGCMQDGQRRYAPLDALKIGYLDGEEVARLSYTATVASDAEDIPGNHLTIVKTAGRYEVITDQLASYGRVDGADGFGPTFFIHADVEGLEQKPENPSSDLRVFLTLSGALLAAMGAAAGIAWLIMGSGRRSS